MTRMRRLPIIGVMGGASADGQELEAAFRLGQVIAEAGWILD